MARFTRAQLTQLIVFCQYWFTVFPLVWFVLQPEFFANNILLSLLLALILLGIYYLIFRLIKCCCSEKKEGETAQNSTHTASRPRSRYTNDQGMQGIENSVYAPTTTSAYGDDEQPPSRRIQMPDAVLYEHVPLSKESLLPGAEEPVEDADEGEEAKNVRFITSCSLYYDGQGHFHDYK